MTLNQEERNKVYDKIFRFLIQYDSYGINMHPFSIKQACQLLNIRLVPLSHIILSTNMKKQDVFSLWGNEDGTVNAYFKGKQCSITIAYNDYSTVGRQRFTICEEIAHAILGHIFDPGFNVFQQNYNEDTYAKYDCEARSAAGILLCNPKFYYQNRDILTLESLGYICSISLSCALVRRDVLNRFQEEITNSPMYNPLPLPKVHYI